jgi:predicted dehydrogenase
VLISVSMKQLLQNVSNGRAVVLDVPAPQCGRGEILVRVGASLVSAGTERMVIEFAEKNIFEKALARPDLVRQVLNKATREGVLSTIQSVRQRLDSELALGYSNAGEVIEVGQGVTEFQVGNRVACAGGGYASHAEIVRIPRNLAAKIPSVRSLRPEIDFEEAAFTTVGSIGLQGLRLAHLELGETVAVIGLGLIGLLVIQLARAGGCTVIGMDIEERRCRLAEQLGCNATATDAQQMQATVATGTDGKGVDAVLITAATHGNAPVELAGEIARDRGRVIAVGAVGLQIPRKVYYEKELSVWVSRSYGPGRYDPEYEEKGRDYPIGYVRWTENRNMQAFLQLLAEGRVNVHDLITHRFPIEQADKAYELISGKTDQSFVGVVISYPHSPSRARRLELSPKSVTTGAHMEKVTVGMLGAGNFASAVLLPVLKSVSNVKLVGLATASGATARAAATRFGFRYCTSDDQELLDDPEINTIVIATRHHLHSNQVITALHAGKHVFCEKPLCLNEAELAAIVKAHEQARSSKAGPMLMVGFNRRFAPLALQLRNFVRASPEPLVMTYRINAGSLPPTHWTQDPEQGGGRIIGEVCHFIDFLVWLVGKPATAVRAAAIPNSGQYCDDNLTATIEFEDGSIGSITYVANGDKSFPKERLEVFGAGSVAVLDDFRSLNLVRKGHTQTFRSRLRQDKGHRGEWEAFSNAIHLGSPAPIALDELINSTLTSFEILTALRRGERRVVASQI